jgi:hypothetical protein
MRVELLNHGDLNSLKYLITWVLHGLLLLLLLEQAAERWLAQGWFWENLLLIFSSLFSFLFSLLFSFSLFFPLEDSIKEYYHHTEEEIKDYEPCTMVFNPRITKHCDLRGEGVENGVACDSVEGILSSVCFALSEMGVEGAGGGFISERWCSVAEWWWWSRCYTTTSATEGRGPGVASDDGGGGWAEKGVWVADHS